MECVGPTDALAAAKRAPGRRSRCASRPATRRRPSARSWRTVRRNLVDHVAARRRGGGHRRRLDRRHRRGRRLGGRPRARRRRRSCPSCRPARARATRSGCRCTRATATSSAGSTPTSATSAPTSSPGCSQPLLTDPAIGFVKGYYRRPLHGEATGGGRVTELMARPVISALFPHLAGFVQPLAGEYAGRRDAARDGAVRRGLGRRDRAARSISSPIRHRRASRRSTSTCASTATGRSRSSVPRRWRSWSPGCAAPASPSTSGSPELVRYDDDQHAQADRGRDPRAPADRHRACLPREVRA